MSDGAKAPAAVREGKGDPRGRAASTLVLDVAALALGRCLGIMPWASMRVIGNGLGPVIAFLSGRKRTRVAENLAQTAAAERAGVRREIWSHFARTVLEILWLCARGPAAIDPPVVVEGRDDLREAARLGRGVLLVSGHLGNWELVSLQAALAGEPVAVVARPMRTPRLERLIIAMRSRGGVRTLLRDRPGASVAAYRWLSRGGVLGCMLDRTSGEKRMLVPFLGRGTHVPIGPATLACRTGAAIVLGTARRLTGGKIAVRFRRLSADGVVDPQALTRIAAAAIENEVRLAPEQWLWIYRSQPEWDGRPLKPVDAGAEPAEHGRRRGRIPA